MISIGIDISKEKSTVCMLRPYGEVVEPPYDVAHNESELNALIEHIQSFDEDEKSFLKLPAAITILSYLKCFLLESSRLWSIHT